MSVELQNFSVQVKEMLNDKSIAYLHEAGGELAAQAARNTRRGRTGQTAGEWTYKVDESDMKATVGNPLENAIWEEFGTGEYALHGDGRRGGWYYQDEHDGKWHHTYGKTPNRALHNAFTSLKTSLIRMAQEIFRG